MKKHVGVITSDLILYNKIRLLLRDTANVTLAAAEEGADRYDVLFCDVESTGTKAGAIMIGDGCSIPRAFRHEELLDALEHSGEPEACISLSATSNEAYVLGETIKLTEVEYKLLDVILASDGFVSKEALLKSVWGEGYDLGVVNVYVHYLRRKLEKDGKKVIISSRNEGYKISENYRRKV